jgi:YD repeat-containing protein
VKTQNDATDLNLNGKVKSIKVTSYETIDSFGEISKVSESKIYNSNENDIQYSYISFNENGMITESLYYTIGMRDEAEIRNFIKYNEYGLKSEVREFVTFGVSDVKTENITTFSYNDKKRLIEKKTVNAVYTYKYDENGNKIEEKKFYKNSESNDNFEELISFKYDDSGNVIEENHQSFNSLMNLNIKNCTLFRYDKNKNLLEEKYYSISSSGEMTFNNIVIYNYDNNNNLVEKTEKGANGNLISKNTFKYNEIGLVVEEIEINSYGDNYKQNFKYEFDKENNWIKKTIFINDKPSALHERKIEYY